MDISISNVGAFSSTLIKLSPGENFVSESGALYRKSSNVDIDVTTRSRGSGGLMSGIKRMVAGENFFFSTYRSNSDDDGEIGLAPTIEGQIAMIECDGRNKWLCAGGSYLGSNPELEIDTQFQGLKGMFSGESLSFLSVEGRGELLVSAFGRVNLLEVEGALIVDTGHVVAFEDSLEYTVTKAGGSWIQSWLTGEGLVLRFAGHGRVYVQSHNPDEYGKELGPKVGTR